MSKKPSGAFSPVIMIALVVVGVFAFSAFFTLLAFAPELTSRRDGRAHALSQSAVGYAGIVRLARSRGDFVNVTRVDRRPDPPALTIVTPDHGLTANDLAQIGGRAILIVLPKWMVGPSQTHPGWVARFDAMPEGSVANVVGQVAGKPIITRATGEARTTLTFPARKTETPQLTTGSIDRLQTIAGDGVSPIVTDAANHIVLGRLPDRGRQEVYVLSDPDFLNTQGIADLDTARASMAMLDLLHDSDDEMVFDVTLNGLGRARNVLRMAFEAPFLPATLCLLAAACLLGWRAALRAGPSAIPARAIALGKSALADNSAALIRLAGREPKMGAGYAALTGANVAELIGAQRMTETDTTAMLDSVGQSQGVSATFSELAAEAAAANTSARMLAAARKLHAWKEEMLRATG